jgi:hypothetical protein
LPTADPLSSISQIILHCSDAELDALSPDDVLTLPSLIVERMVFN